MTGVIDTVPGVLCFRQSCKRMVCLRVWRRLRFRQSKEKCRRILTCTRPFFRHLFSRNWNLAVDKYLGKLHYEKIVFYFIEKFWISGKMAAPSGTEPVKLVRQPRPIFWRSLVEGEALRARRLKLDTDVRDVERLACCRGKFKINILIIVKKLEKSLNKK